MRGLAWKITLLCSDLGRIHRGNEVFAAGLHVMLEDKLDIMLFKCVGSNSDRQIVVPHAPRNLPQIQSMEMSVAPKWHAAAVQHYEIAGLKGGIWTTTPRWPRPLCNCLATR